MGVFDRWFGPAAADPTVAARQRAAAWGAFLAAQRAALPPRPVGTAPLATAIPAMPPVVMAAPTTASTTVLVIEDGEEGV
ncbi:hypothetical protein [Herpetosiphon llansteffanensis]|uniref:hypothetical protein n=1 Tax=Herpetosiphon llansteffanensis TaxID=2094568 RepID=UPI000D7C10A3|nr:hypothetical protein [Herpetosiphon llansteffanensis]